MSFSLLECEYKMHIEQIEMNEQGRVVIPARLRKTLGLQGKQKLAIWVSNGKLVIEKLDDVKADLKAAFKDLPRQGISLSEELIDERRAEAKREHPAK